MLKALHLPGGGGGGGLVVYQLSGEAAEGGGGDGGGKRRRKVALLFVTADKTVAQRALARAAPPRPARTTCAHHGASRKMDVAKSFLFAQITTTTSKHAGFATEDSKAIARWRW